MDKSINRVLGTFPPEILSAISNMDIKVWDYRIIINTGGGYHITFWHDKHWQEKFWEMGPIVVGDTTIEEFEEILTRTLKNIIIDKVLA